MFKLACVFLLFACVLIVNAAIVRPPAEERKAIIQWIGISTDYNTSQEDVTVLKAYDGDINSWIASTYERQPFLTVTLAEQVYITYVDIVNRQDCCQDRINPFTVFLGRYDNGDRKTVDEFKAQVVNPVYDAWRDGTGTNSTYRIAFPRTFAIHSRFQIHKTDYLNIAEISFVYLYRPTYTGAAASSIYPGTSLSNALDSNLNTWFATDYVPNTDPWFEVYFPAQRICRVHVWNRYEPCCSGRIDPFVVAIKLGNFSAKSLSPTLTENYCMLEVETVCSPEQTGIKEYYEVDFPTQPYGDRIRIFQKNEGYLNIADIQVYSCNFPSIGQVARNEEEQEQEAN